MASASDKMSLARSNLVLHQPFFGALAMTMRIIEDPKIPTARTNGATVWYNPKWILGLSDSQATGLLAHEVLHPAFLHMTRRGTRDPQRWNAAADYVINPIVREAGLDLPPDGLEDKKYAGKSTDEVYNLLPEDFASSGDMWNFGEVVDATDNTTEVEATAKLRLAQAVLVGRQAGKLPNSIERLTDELFTPVIPWRDVLRRFMTEPCDPDFCWNRPNRRLLYRGLYLPSSVAASNAMQDIVVAIDTSGSIGAEELQEFGSELDGIHKQVRPRQTVVIYCDASVNRVDIFRPDDTLTLRAVGGGGTDFRPPFEYVNTHGIIPKCFVYLTDGYGAYPEMPPPYPTLWVMTSAERAPYGETLPLRQA